MPRLLPFQQWLGHLRFSSMSSARKRRAIVALAAAYALVLQAMMLAVGGSMGGAPAVAAGLMCWHRDGAAPHQAPAGPGDCCSASCLACCGGTPAMPTPTLAIIGERRLAEKIGVKFAIAASVLPAVACAHRSRAPPYGPIAA
jgi:hypothetical protein